MRLRAGQSYVGHDGMEVSQLRLGPVVILDVCFITVLNVLQMAEDLVVGEHRGLGLENLRTRLSIRDPG